MDDDLVVDASFWGAADDFDSSAPDWVEDGWERESDSGSFFSDFAEPLDDSEPSLASASAPERSSPSSPMMAMVAPTSIALAPSSTYTGK